MLGIRHFNKTAIDLFQGDITEFACDAMVNAANTALKGGGGVDGAIHRVGGPTIMDELGEYDGCPPGEAVVTRAGELPAQWVIHAVGPIWDGGKGNEGGLLASAYARSLNLASELGVGHVAFPSISTGAYRFPLADAAAIAMTTVRTFLEGRDTPPLRRITFVLFDAIHYRTFRDQLFALFPEDDE